MKTAQEKIAVLVTAFILIALPLTLFGYRRIYLTSQVQRRSSGIADRARNRWRLDRPGR